MMLELDKVDVLKHIIQVRVWSILMKVLYNFYNINFKRYYYYEINGKLIIEILKK